MLTRLRALLHHLNHAKMSTASTSDKVHNTNVACCTIPPVKSDYNPKGFYKSYAGFDKVNNIRPPIVIVYLLSCRRSTLPGPGKLLSYPCSACSIFSGEAVRLCAHLIRILTFSPSLQPQTLQGADILAEELKAQVIMPDFFEGHEPWPLDKFPPKTEEDKQEFQKWFGSVADPARHIPRVIQIGETLKEDGAEFVLGYGYCWGECRVVADLDLSYPRISIRR